MAFTYLSKADMKLERVDPGINREDLNNAK